jgi:hypothetical protein
MHTRTISLALFLGCLLPTLSAQVTVQIQADRNNTLYQDATGSLSNGQGTAVFAGLTNQQLIRRALLRFPVDSVVPAGARVVSVTLAMNVTRTASPNPVNVAVHRVLADWGEGTSLASGGEGGGGAATNGDATWLHTFFPSQFWTTPGGDFTALASTTAATPVSGSVTFGSDGGMVGDAQSFLDDPTHNYGWLLKTDETAGGQSLRFDSRHSPTVANRPVLSVTYVAPGNVGAFGTGCLGSNGLVFQLASQGGAVLGGTLTLTMSNGLSNAMAAHLLSFGLRPAPLPLAPGCLFQLEPLPGGGYATPGLETLDAGGSVVDPFAIPAVPALSGLAVGFQAVAVDAQQPLGYVLSNALLAVVQ